MQGPILREMFLTNNDYDETDDWDDTQKKGLRQQILDSEFTKRLVLFVRSHPALFILLFIIVVCVIQGVIFSALVTDIIVALELVKANQAISFAVYSSFVCLFVCYFVFFVFFLF